MYTITLNHDNSRWNKNCLQNMLIIYFTVIVFLANKFHVISYWLIEIFHHGIIYLYDKVGRCSICVWCSCSLECLNIFVFSFVSDSTTIMFPIVCHPSLGSIFQLSVPSFFQTSTIRKQMYQFKKHTFIDDIKFSFISVVNYPFIDTKLTYLNPT